MQLLYFETVLCHLFSPLLAKTAFGHLDTLRGGVTLPAGDDDAHQASASVFHFCHGVLV